ncbi:MAG: alpha/beta fold hydrolase [Myxococcales bacterium]|nr:alpha/beta fold hydrolase [Myxococcales bacterium]
MRAAVLLSLVLTGCFLASPTPPLRTLQYTPHGPSQARGLVVLLPGFGDDGGVFERYEVISLLEREPNLDAIGVHAHFGYYLDFSVLPRLEADVIGPAISMGYRDIWLVGTSMGGFGATSYAAAHPRDVAGVILIAPYLGEPAVLDEIRAQGLEAWEPWATRNSSEIADRDAVTRRNWAWIREQVAAPSGTPIYLAWGEQDPSVETFALLADMLPAERVFHIPGPHGWAAWTPLLETIAPIALSSGRRARAPRRDAAAPFPHASPR